MNIKQNRWLQILEKCYARIVYLKSFMYIVQQTELAKSILIIYPLCLDDCVREDEVHAAVGQAGHQALPHPSLPLLRPQHRHLLIQGQYKQ